MVFTFVFFFVCFDLLLLAVSKNKQVKCIHKSSMDPVSQSVRECKYGTCTNTTEKLKNGRPKKYCEHHLRGNRLTKRAKKVAAKSTNNQELSSGKKRKRKAATASSSHPPEGDGGDTNADLYKILNHLTTEIASVRTKFQECEAKLKETVVLLAMERKISAKYCATLKRTVSAVSQDPTV